MVTASRLGLASAHIVGDLITEGYLVSNSMPAYSAFSLAGSLTLATAQCMISTGYTMIVQRAYNACQGVLTECCGSLQNAKTAGVAVRDAYM